ncbi:TetR/AcrR family transcriptional regulator [Aquisediminimonas profunda]|uniref:TetR/AcrR family transcriptional regulator n=1 Tax=Aquisediminimonas profunda TaxID=1550733 RepID=UPI001C627546|nr:TetR/AcrR family transcriptional regulator [Aquisediminimonas profunda]
MDTRISIPALNPAVSADSDPKTALILAAEIAFARDGIEGASLREIAARSGQRNHHAVQYHFGTREALVQAVFDYRMDQMEAARAAMLRAARETGRIDTTRAIVEAIFLPQIALIDEFGDHSYAAFLNQYLLRYQGKRFGEFGERRAQHLDEILHLLRMRMPDLPDPAAQRRLITACFMFLNILNIHLRASDSAEENFEVAVNDTIDQIVLTMEAPYTP